MALEPVRALATAEAWAMLASFRRSFALHVALGDRWPDSEVAVYAYWRASVDCNMLGENEQRGLHLARRAVEVAQHDSPRFAVAFGYLARLYRKAGRRAPRTD